MSFLKSVLVGSLGVIGYVLWFLIGAVLLYTPLIFLDLHFVVDFILIIVMISIPFLGELTEFGTWIWSFVVVISEPIDGWSIFYFVTFAFYFFTTILPIVVSLIANLVESLVSRKN